MKVIRLSFLCFSICFYAFSSSFDTIDEHYQVNMVELQVKVQDLGGNFIPGLKADDIVVKENGTVQEIAQLDEIRLNDLPPAESQDYQSRLMILLDFKNTKYVDMRRVFPQLKDFVLTLHNKKTQLGLAVNEDGIIEFSGFTTDTEQLLQAIEKAEQFYHRSPFRNHTSVGLPTDAGGFPYGFRAQKAFQVNRDFIDEYYQKELEALAQFVRYLGAHTGKKNLLLISGFWSQNGNFEAEGSRDREGITSLKDIQTVCIKQKTAVSVINVEDRSPFAAHVAHASQVRDSMIFERTMALAASTAGSYYRANARNLAKLIDRSLRDGEHYYRVRYYSQYSGDKFRKISVKAKGLKRLAHTTFGFFPSGRTLDPMEVNGRLKHAASLSYDLFAASDWLNWETFGWFKQRANYAYAQRLFDQQGNLVYEQVQAGELHRRYKRAKTVSPPIQEHLKIPAVPQGEPAFLEVILTDLSSGKTVTFQKPVPPKTT